MEDRMDQRIESAVTKKEKLRLENSRAFLTNLKANVRTAADVQEDSIHAGKSG